MILYFPILYYTRTIVSLAVVMIIPVNFFEYTVIKRVLYSILSTVLYRTYCMIVVVLYYNYLCRASARN